MATKRTIGVLSRQCGVKVTTIRYYESIALIAEPDRTQSGQRIYEDSAVERLNFIRHARDLGFPIETIRALIDLQNNPDKDCVTIDKLARHHLTDVRLRLSQLEALEAELKRMVSACAGGAVSDCKILETLDNHENCIDEHGSRTDAGQLRAAL